MYGSMRFFIDPPSRSVSNDILLKTIDLFASELGTSFDYIYYTLLDPENDKIMTDEKFQYNEGGKQEFLKTRIIPQATGIHGDLSAPNIGATFICQPDELYNRVLLDIRFPVCTMPLIIRVDFEHEILKNKISFNTFYSIISGLSAVGLRVNNSLYHIYSNKKTSASFDGGQIGQFSGVSDRIIQRKYLKHIKNRCMNHLMGVFCANSLVVPQNSVEKVSELKALLGANNVNTVDDIIVFALPKLEDVKSDYHFRYRKLLQRVEVIL